MFNPSHWRRALPLLLSLSAPSWAQPKPDQPPAQAELDRAAQLLQQLAQQGPLAPDGRPLFPKNLEIVGQDLAQRLIFVRGPFDAHPLHEELRLESWVGALAAADVHGGATVMIEQADAPPRPLGGAAAPEDGEADTAQPPPPKPAPALSPHQPRKAGALAGRRIALSAGHGWVKNSNGSWGTQRSRWTFEGCGSTCRGITEDFFTAELVSRNLIPMLENMGATVVLVREPDHDEADAVILDDSREGYGEIGEGFGDGANAGGFEGTYRTLAPGLEDEAVYSPNVGGKRRLSVRWREGENRTTDAQLQIDHMGGSTVLSLNQRNYGRFWLDLGQYFFDPAQSTITLRHGSGDGYLITDALKLGGGRFTEANKPWWQMAAQSYVPWAGATPTVEGRNDVTIRPGYAEHVGADLYISVHANASGVAGGSSANGLSTYRYSCQQYADHSSGTNAVNCDYPAGSAAFANTVHQAIIQRLRSDWDPGYRDIGVRVANFGELRELRTMPGALIETGFFDNLANPTGSARMADNRSLHDPRWREAFAYGFAAGVARHFGGEAPPVRPTGLYARNTAEGGLALSWDPVEGATGYRIYMATQGRAWDAGTEVGNPRVTFARLEPGRVYTFRVAALNLHGEGMPSQAVGARYRGARLLEGAAPAQALLVQAYDRLDAFVQEEDNDLQYAVEHSHALGAVPGLYFDGLLDERLEAEPDLAQDYALIDLAAGKDSTEHDAISAPMQAILRGFAEAGGALLVSGEEIGWDLVERSNEPAEALFLSQVLGAEFVADSGQSHQVTAQGVLASLGELQLDDGTGGVYAVRYPDVFAPSEAADTVMTYPDGTAAGVATAHSLLFGFPLEAVVPDAQRAALHVAAVDYLLGELPEAWDTDGDGASDECERRYGFDPYDARDGAEDADGDGRDLATECAQGTNPRVPDTPGQETDSGVPQDGGGLDAGVPSDAHIEGDAEGPRGDAASPADRGPSQPPADQGRPGTQQDQHVEPEPQPDGGWGGEDAGPQRKAAGSGGCQAQPSEAPAGLAGALAILLLGLRRRRG